MKFVKEQQNPVKVKQRFSLRKLKIGTVSVMLGTTFFFMGGAINNVKADTVSQTDQPVQDSNYQEQNNQEQTQNAVKAVQDYLGNNGEVQSDQAVTIDRTIQYQEEGTNKTLHPDANQDVSIVPYYKVGHVTINYIDQTNNQSLGQDGFKGYFGTHVQQSQGENLINTKVNSLGEKGYQYVSDNFNPEFNEGGQLQFTEAAHDFSFNVYFTHGIKTVNTTLPGSQTVEYVDQDGKKLRDNTVTSFTFEKTGRTVDSVTGKVITPGKWKTESHQFGKVKAPEIAGYTPVNEEVDGATITTEQPNKVVRVVYKKNATEEVTVTIEYIDQDDNNKVLYTDTVSGKPGASIDYEKSNRIKDYLGMGYQYVSDNYPEVANFPQKATTYQVILKHASIPVAPDNPGQPVNPATPVFPTTFALYAASKAKSQVVAEQPTTYYAIVQHGKILAQDLDEQQAKSKLFDVVSPTIPGYRLVDDKQKLIDQMLVDAKSNKHTTITVYYTKNSSIPAQPTTPTETPTTPEQPSMPTEKPTTPQQPTTPVVPETPTSPTTPEETPAPKPGTNETPEVPTDSVKVIPGTPDEQVVPDNQDNSQSLVNKTSWPVQNQGKVPSTNNPTTQSQLPQTGNQRHAGLIGLAVLGALFSLLGFKGKRDSF